MKIVKSKSEEDRNAAFVRLVEAEEAKKLKRSKRKARIFLSLSEFVLNPIVKVAIWATVAYFVTVWAWAAFYWPIKYFMELW